jgi:hypothetical protein
LLAEFRVAQPQIYCYYSHCSRAEGKVSVLFKQHEWHAIYIMNGEGHVMGNRRYDLYRVHL